MALTDNDFKTIKQLGDTWPYDWVATKGLAPYIKRLGENLTGVEIGTCRAESTAYLLDKCPNIIKLYTIDPYKAYDDWNGEITQDTVDKFKKIAQANLKQYKDRVEMITEDSDKAFTRFEDETLDFVFVDGDHSYQTTYNDCVNYYPKLKKGGFFCGHDYTYLETVHDAVDAFRKDNNITSPLNLSTNATFFWYK